MAVKVQASAWLVNRFLSELPNEPDELSKIQARVMADLRSLSKTILKADEQVVNRSFDE